METRANHLLIGSFVLIVIGIAFGFLIWLAKVDIDREFVQYHVYFEESVAGLSVGGDVRFNGIPVGTVSEIRIAPNDPSRVQVLIEVAVGTPVRADTEATLAFKGITGVSFVQLSGGSPEKSILKAEREGEIPVIASTPSAFHELFSGAPELIDRVIVVVDRLAEIVNKNNQENFANILDNIDGITTEVNKSMPEFRHILENADGITTKLDERMPEVGRILVNVDEITADLRMASKDFGQLIKRLDALAVNANTTVTVARETMTTADDLLRTDVKKLIKNVDTLAVSADTTVIAARDTLATADELMKNDVKKLIKNVDSLAVNADTTVTVARDTMTTADQLMQNDIKVLIKDIDSLALNADETVTVARDTMKTANDLVQNDVKLLLKDFRAAANAFEKLNSDLDSLLVDNREPLDLFASQGLVEFTKLIEEARILVGSSTRLIDELQTDPAQFIFGRQKGGLKAE